MNYVYANVFAHAPESPVTPVSRAHRYGSGRGDGYGNGYGNGVHNGTKGDGCGCHNGYDSGDGRGSQERVNVLLLCTRGTPYLYLLREVLG